MLHHFTLFYKFLYAVKHSYEDVSFSENKPQEFFLRFMVEVLILFRFLLMFHFFHLGFFFMYLIAQPIMFFSQIKRADIVRVRYVLACLPQQVNIVTPQCGISDGLLMTDSDSDSVPNIVWDFISDSEMMEKRGLSAFEQSFFSVIRKDCLKEVIV